MVTFAPGYLRTAGIGNDSAHRTGDGLRDCRCSAQAKYEKTKPHQCPFPAHRSLTCELPCCHARYPISSAGASQSAAGSKRFLLPGPSASSSTPANPLKDDGGRNTRMPPYKGAPIKKQCKYLIYVKCFSYNRRDFTFTLKCALESMQCVKRSKIPREGEPPPWVNLLAFSRQVSLPAPTRHAVSKDPWSRCQGLELSCSSATRARWCAIHSSGSISAFSKERIACSR